MPELPEVEITARLLSEAVAGATIESTLTPGVNVLKTFAPPLSALDGRPIDGISRRGKLLLVHAGDLTLLVHLMSAGRLQLWDKRAGLRDRTSRLLVRLDGGRELRLREFGTKQAAWVKLLDRDGLAAEETLTTMGPEAWPDPPALQGLLAGSARPLYTVLRDQQVIAGIGRTWVDEILHAARLSPFKRADDLGDAEAAALRTAIRAELQRGVDEYAARLKIPIPEKIGKPVRVHAQQGSPCWRCGTTLEAVHFEEYVMGYCPHCQTDGRVLKDRRLSRLLK